MVDKEEQERDYYDEQERRQEGDFKAGRRNFPKSNNVLLMMGRLLDPVIKDFKHISMDMSFTQLDSFSLKDVKNSSFLINYFALKGFRRCYIIQSNDLATDLIARRSLGAKSMDLFTNVTATQKQEFVDHTEKKTGFAKIFSKKKGSEEA